MKLLRGLVVVKRHTASWFRIIAAPLGRVGHFLVLRIWVPIYKFTYSLRRVIQKVARPAKSQVMYVISNKYAVHALVVLIAIAVTNTNLLARDVRAETFGQESLLYKMVAADDANIVEVIDASTPVVSLGSRSSYLADTVVDLRLHSDFDYLEKFATTDVGEPVESRPEVSKREAVETHIVQEGDTIGQIAERFGLSISTILWSNGLSFTSTIRPGDSLKILPDDGVLYTVKSGDTLSRIASNYDVDVQDIMKENNIGSTETLSIGQELLLPGGEPPTPASTVTSTRRSTSSVAELFTAPTPAAPTQSAGWVWPTDWRVITQYYGWRHTGLDVDGDYSTYSYASRGGVVIYSGWRSGYGLTVEIDHGDGFVTRYAHHSKNYVGYGDVVTMGQAIAQTGTTGRSTGTHLHFEIIKNGRFQNPLDYLR